MTILQYEQPNMNLAVWNRFHFIKYRRLNSEQSIMQPSNNLIVCSTAMHTEDTRHHWFFFFFTPSLSNAGALFQADSTVNTFNNSLQTFTLEYTIGVMIVAFFLFLHKSFRELRSMH